VTEQYVTASTAWTNWVTSLPIGIIWLVSGAFMLGLILQDLYNPKSWIWANWRHLNRLFEIRSVGRQINQLGDIGRVGIDIHAVREIPSAKVRLFIYPRISSHPQMPVLAYSTDSFIAAKHQNTDIWVATIPIQRSGWTPKHMLWGNGDDGNKQVIAQTENVAKLIVKSGWRRQEFTFRVNIWGQSEDDFSRITVIREDVDLFDTA